LSQKKVIPKKQTSESVETKPTFILVKDIEFDDVYARIEKMSIMINGVDGLVKCELEFLAPKEKYELINILILNHMLQTSNFKVPEYYIKNKYTYIPRKIKILYLVEENNWDVEIEFTAQNDFGAIKTGKSHSVFEVNGKYKKTDVITFK
jgi:hypothetical protein